MLNYLPQSYSHRQKDTCTHTPKIHHLFTERDILNIPASQKQNLAFNLPQLVKTPTTAPPSCHSAKPDLQGNIKS